MLHPTLAGHLPLTDMIQQTIESARTKIAAEEESEKVKKLVDYEKKEHGGKIPSPKEEKEEHEKEKKSSILDYSDPEEMDKLASALDEMADELVKEADSIENGGESKQGGEQLPTQSLTGGKQSYKRDSAHHQVPNNTGLQADPSQGKASTQVPNDHARAPGGTGAKYPAKGVLKTAGELCEKCKKEPCICKKETEKKSAVANLQAALEKMAGKDAAPGKEKKSSKSEESADRRRAAGSRRAGAAIGTLAGAAQGLQGGHPLLGAAVGGGLGYAGGEIRHHLGKALAPKEKRSAADFILDKVAEFHGGGETLDDKSLAVPMPPGRSLVQNKDQIKNVTKREAKAPRKAELAQVLTEPALTKSTDSKVQDNLRNAAKGGVKIAEAVETLQKIAADPNDPRHEALKQAIADRKAAKESGENMESDEKKS